MDGTIMIVWIGLILYLLVIRLIFPNTTDKLLKKQYLLLSGIGIVLIMALRYPDYGKVYDLKLYYEYYKAMIHLPWKQIFEADRFEPGYAILNKVLATLIPWPQFILFAEAIFCVWAAMRYIYRHTDHPFYAVIFYVALGTMSFQLTAFRQAFAISLCLLSVDYIKERKVWAFLALVGLAISFHKTAVAFLPMYFLAGRKLNMKNNVIAIAFLGTMVVAAPILANVGNRLLFEADHSAEFSGSAIGGIIQMAIYLLALFISALYARRTGTKTHINMLGLGLGIYAARFASTILERISFYYVPACMVVLPEAIHLELDEKIRKILQLFSVFMAVILFLYRMYSSSHLNSYRFFWQ